MQAASATSSPFHVSGDSDIEEEVSQLVLRRRTSRVDLGLKARDKHLDSPSQGSLPPQRSAPPIPSAAKLALQPADIARKIQSLSLRERERPAPISTAAGTEVWSTPPQSPSEWSPPLSPASPTGLSSLTSSASSSPRASPSSWPSTPEALSPVPAPLDTKAKARAEESPPPTPPSAKASTSAAPPGGAGPVSPDEAVKLARQFERFTEEAGELLALEVPSVPAFPGLNQDRAVDLHEFLREHRYLIRTEDDLLVEQDSLRKVLAGGQLRGIDPDRLAELTALSTADLGPQFRALRRLQADFAEAQRRVESRGIDPTRLTRRAPSREEIEARSEAARMRHQAQIDAGYGF